MAKLSITGVGIRSHAGVKIDLVSTSEVRFNVGVAAEYGGKSLVVLRKAFGL